MLESEQAFPELGFYALAGAPESTRDILTEVRTAEEMGLGTAFIGERLNYKEAAMAAGAAGAVSERMRIATAATNHQTRFPTVTAGFATSMHSLTGGRFSLGFARGVDRGWDAMGLPRVTNARLADFVGILRRLFAGEMILGHDGPAGNFPYLRLMDLEPVHIDLGFVAIGPKSMEFAGTIFDQVVLHTFLTDEYTAEAVRLIRQGAERAGRDPDAIEVWSCFATVGDHVEYPLRMKKTVGRLSTYLQAYGDLLVGVNDWDPAVLERFRTDDFVADFQGQIDGVATTEDLERIATLIPDEWFANMASGSPKECVAAVRNQFDLGCDGVIMHGATPEQLAPIVTEYAKG